MNTLNNVTALGATRVASTAPFATSGAAATERGTMLARVWQGLRLAIAASRSRRDLLEVDDRMLKDLGVSRAQAEFEASRAPWHLMPHDSIVGRK